MDYLRHFAIDVGRLSIWLLLLSALFVPLERLWALHPQKIFRRGVGSDVGYYFLNSLLLNVLLIVPMAALAWGLHAIVPNPLRAWAAGLSFGQRFPIALVVGEFGCYWAHRWMHGVPFLWRFHAVHHTAEEIDWLVSNRAHPLDLVFTRLSGFVPLYVFGLAQPIENMADPVSLAVVLTGTVWAFFIHANIRWRFGPLEWLVATPAFHHWHHTNDEHFNHNYSTMLPWVDRIFGTHYMPRDRWPPSYGIDDKLPDSIADQLVYPLLPRGRSAATPLSSQPPPG
jgi:sterol desaturase/sphingolipid hydroxylase (fatty acid hydroxylase superfamily)